MGTKRTTRDCTKPALTLFFLLRFFQFAAASIVGFIYCFLIWHHNNHYCAFYADSRYPGACNAEDLANVKVPWQYVLVTFTGILCFLNIIITSCYFLVTLQEINYRLVTVTDGVLLALYSMCLGVIFKVPGSSGTCFLFREYDPRGQVAAKNCVIVQDGMGALGFVVGFTGLVVLSSLIMVVTKAARDSATEQAVVPTAASGVDGEFGASEKGVILQAGQRAQAQAGIGGP